MADRQNLKDRAKTLFLSSIIGPAPTAAGLEAASPPRQRRFSPFDPDDQDRQAAQTFEVFEAFAEPEDPDDGLSAALDVLEGAATSGDMMMAQHVLGVFAAHASKVRVDTTSVPVPPLAFSAGEFETIGDAPLAPADGGDAILSGEDLLHWFREDIHLNEHHRHWHMVYATSGIPSGTPAQPSLPVRMKKRQGEILSTCTNRCWHGMKLSDWRRAWKGSRRSMISPSLWARGTTRMRASRKISATSRVQTAR